MPGDAVVGRGTAAVVATLGGGSAAALANPIAPPPLATPAAGYGDYFRGSLDGPVGWPLSTTVAAIVGLLVFQRFRSSGWAWLTLAGALLNLSAGLAMALLVKPPWWFPPALGAGSALLIVG